MATIRIRFVRHRGIATYLISWREATCMPFIPSHAECVTPAGTRIGEFGFGGMQERPFNYDTKDVALLPKGKTSEALPLGNRCEIIVPLEVSQEQSDKFYKMARASLGQGYDWSAIPGFALSGHHHKVGRAVCSAKMFLLLRAVNYFKWPVSVPAHLINPRDLMLILSTHVEIPH
jgi:hypothetical protein